MPVPPQEDDVYGEAGGKPDIHQMAAAVRKKRAALSQMQQQWNELVRVSTAKPRGEVHTEGTCCTCHTCRLLQPLVATDWGLTSDLHTKPYRHFTLVALTSHPPPCSHPHTCTPHTHTHRAKLARLSCGRCGVSSMHSGQSSQLHKVIWWPHALRRPANVNSRQQPSRRTRHLVSVVV